MYKKIDQNGILKLFSSGYTMGYICSTLTVSEYQVRKVLKLNGLKYGTKNDRLKDKHYDIIQSYGETNNMSEVGKIYNISPTLVKKILNQNGVQKIGTITERLNVNEVIKFYEEVRVVKIVAEKFKVSNSVILKLLHSNNIRVSVMKHSDEELIEKYKELKRISTTAKFFNISETYISNVLKRNNIESFKLRTIDIGSIFGKLTIIDELEKKVTSGGNKVRQFLLRCECGNVVIRNIKKLSDKKSTHCGCVTIEKKRIKEEKNKIREQKRIQNKKPTTKKKYVVGYKHHRLTILSEVGTGDKKVFTVECGTIKEISSVTIREIKSCGCLQREKSYKNGLFTKNDKEKELMYARYKNMKRRCYNEKNNNYPNYGGRGIIVCDRWMEPNGMGFVNFCEDMGPRPSSKHSIDRINNDGNYEPSNCKWSTNSEQVKNQRRYLKK
jgi:hypothetical protein